MELGNYHPTSSLTMSQSSAALSPHRSSLSSAAFFASEDETSASSLASSFFSHLPSSSSSSTAPNASSLSADGYPLSSSAQSSFSPYRVEYVSSAMYPANSLSLHRKRWGMRCLNLLLLLGVVALFLWLLLRFGGGRDSPAVIHGGSTVGMWAAGKACAIQKSKECRSYVYPQGLEQDHVELVDVFPSPDPSGTIIPGYLFRTNLPLLKTVGVFSEEQLLAFMAKEARTKNIPFPAKVQLHDFCLLNDAWNENGLDEKCEIASEKCWFEENPTGGAFVNYPLVGEATSPFDLKDPAERVKRAKAMREWSSDGLDKKVEEIRRILASTGGSTPQVLFFHCHYGKDRTGLVSSAYRMKFQNYSLMSAWKENERFYEDAPEFVNEMLWYCYFLEANYPLHPKCDEWSPDYKLAEPDPSKPRSGPPYHQSTEGLSQERNSATHSDKQPTEGPATPSEGVSLKGSHAAHVSKPNLELQPKLRNM